MALARLISAGTVVVKKSRSFDSARAIPHLDENLWKGKCWVSLLTRTASRGANRVSLALV